MGIILITPRSKGRWPARVAGRLGAVGVVALLGGASLGLAACSTGGGSSDTTPGAPLDVVVSFYPLEYVVQRLGGPDVRVHNLTPPGGEPHDLELTADDLVRLRNADLVVHLGGFAPSVDDGVATAARNNALDVRGAARLVAATSGVEGSLAGLDPHFWLDPLRLADVADLVAEQLARIDPAHARTFLGNTARLRTELEALDTEFVAGLATCRVASMVTSHAAFGYLALRYGLTQVSVSGISPEAEPTATALAQVADFVRNNGVTTVYTEVLASSEVATTLAKEVGVATAVLDPLEGLADAASGDYLSVMRANLTTLRAGQGCT